jgi:hypothetical protein
MTSSPHACKPLVALFILYSCLLTTYLQADSKQVFESKIRPFLKEYCVSCHGADKAKGKIRLDAIKPVMKAEKDARLWARVLEALEFGEMPPDGAKTFPTQQEARVIETWISSSLANEGIAVEEKQSEQGFGNLVNHDLLFGKEARNNQIDVAARLWRISPNALIKQIVTRLKVTNGAWLTSGDVFGRRMQNYQFDTATNPFKLDKPHGSFRDFKGKYLFNSLMAEQVTELAIGAADEVMDGIRPDLYKRLDNGEEIATIYREYLTGQYQRIIRRRPTGKEMESLLETAKKVDAELGDNQGLRMALGAVILQPESIFRYELGEGAMQQDGLYIISRRDLAHALCFALTDLPPEHSMLKRILEDDRQIKKLLEEEARRMFASNKLVAKRSLQFFQEYFDYEKAADIFKDDKKRVHWPPAYISDLNLLISKVLEKDKQVLHTLLTTREYCLTVVEKSFSRASHLAYNLPADTKRNGSPILMPKDQRMGVLTHPAWLVAHSGNFDNDPIRRGLWIRKHLLGGLVPDIPINVDAKLPEEPNWTLRQRMNVTREEQCYKCHSKMNPLGLPFEQFSDFGRFRRTELGQPVLTTGAITRSGDPALDGEVKNPFEMIQRLSRSKRVEQVFVRHAFRFYMGRNETLGDAGTLQDAYRAYVDSNGSFKALVISLLSSDSFIYRAQKDSRKTGAGKPVKS